MATSGTPTATRATTAKGGLKPVDHDIRLMLRDNIIRKRSRWRR
jgi:hypothetical protein